MLEVTGETGRWLSQLQSPDPGDRRLAVTRLAASDNDAALAGLALCLEDRDLSIREAAADHLAGARSETAARLLTHFLAHEDVGTRNLAAEILVKLGEVGAPALRDEINSDDHDVRRFVCDILGLIGDQAGASVLIERLGDDNLNVAGAAADSLGRLRAVSAIPSLMATAVSRPQVILPIIDALGRIGDASVTNFLYGYLESSDPVIVAVTLEAIGCVGDEESLARVEPFLEGADRAISEMAITACIDIQRRHRTRVVSALTPELLAGYFHENFGAHQAILDFVLGSPPEWFTEELIAGLLKQIRQVDESTWRRIAELLGEVGRRTVGPILECLPRASTSQQMELLEILAQFADEQAAVHLIDMVSHPNPDIRQKIARLFGTSGSPRVVESLKILTTDSHGTVRAAAYSALGWLSSEHEIDLLMAGLDDPYAEVRDASLGALIIIGGPDVVARLTEDLYHPEAERQRLAVTGLGWIGEAEVVPPLLRAVSHPVPAVRKSALHALVRIGEVAEIGPIQLALKDENTGVRKAAVSALVVLRGAAILTDLLPLLEDEDVWVRYHTLSALGQLESPAAAQAVLPFLDDSSDIIRLAAARALAQLDCRKAIPQLRHLTNDRNQDLAAAAQAAVARIEGKV
jgi:HEAT repeat protein